MSKTAGTAPQATVHFTYDEAGRLTGEYNANNQLVQEVLWLDDMPLATLRPRAGQTLQTIPSVAGAGIIVGQLSGATVQVIDTFHIHADHLNTPRVITRPSDNKKVWEWANTEPFGNNAPNENPQAVGAFTFNLAFPGQYRDKETGLNYNYYRDYNPSTGRYQQSDPIGLLAGPATYGYVSGKPLSLFDPWGLCQIAVWRGGYIEGWRSCDQQPTPTPNNTGSGRSSGTAGACNQCASGSAASSGWNGSPPRRQSFEEFVQMIQPTKSSSCQLFCSMGAVATFGLKEAFIQGVAEPACARVIGHTTATAGGLALWGAGWYGVTYDLTRGCAEKCEEKQTRFLRSLYESSGR